MPQFIYPTLPLLNQFFFNNTKNISFNNVSNYFWKGMYPNAIDFFSVPFNAQSRISQNPNYQIMGIDVPVLIKDDSKESKGTIVILAQDPLRNIKDFQGRFNISKDIIVGLPFAVQADLGGGTTVWHGIIKGLLKKGYSVYLTDVHKFYAGALINGKQKLVYKPNKSEKAHERQLLSDEINVLNPVYVAAFGNTAQTALSNIQQNITCNNHVLLPHPSRSNNKKWAPIKKQQGWTSASDDNKINYILNHIP